MGLGLQMLVDLGASCMHTIFYLYIGLSYPPLVAHVERVGLIFVKGGFDPPPPPSLLLKDKEEIGRKGMT